MHPREGKYKHDAQFTLAVGVAGRPPARGRAGVQLPAPGRGAGAAGARRGRARSSTSSATSCTTCSAATRAGPRSRASRPSGTSSRRRRRCSRSGCWDPDALARFARHVETGEPIPADAGGADARRRRVRQGAAGCGSRCSTRRVSLELHRRDPAGLDTTARGGGAAGALHAVPPRRGHLLPRSFGHLEGYSAIYYTYMWSLVIAKDLFGVVPGGRGSMARAPPRATGGRSWSRAGRGRRRSWCATFLGRPFTLRRLPGVARRRLTGGRAGAVTAIRAPPTPVR